MKLALLGADDDVMALVRALAARHKLEIVAAYQSGAWSAELEGLAPDARLGDEWESLLLGNVADAVIVGRGAREDERADQLRKLAQASVPTIAVHPACEYIVGYELEMIRRDVQGLLIPYYPGIADPAVEKLRQRVEAGVEQVACERAVRRERHAMLTQLARDAEILRRLVGPITKVSAVGALADGAPTTLHVHLTSQSGKLVRWSSAGEVDGEGATITLVDPSGKLAHPLDGDVDSFAAMLPAIIQGETPPPATWMDACRALEIVGHVPRCVERGKTIELYNEEHTEESAFKGVMAVGGCLILMIGLLLVVLVAVVEGLQLPLGGLRLWSAWPALLFLAFFLFLLLQFLGPLARRPPQS